jgi:Transposase DDE domain group 1
MTEDTPLPFDLPAVDRKKITVDFAGGNQSSDGGLLWLRQSEAQLGVCQRVASAMPDHRDQSRIEHQSAPWKGAITQWKTDPPATFVSDMP